MGNPEASGHNFPEICSCAKLVTISGVMFESRDLGKIVETFKQAGFGFQGIDKHSGAITFGLLTTIVGSLSVSSLNDVLSQFAETYPDMKIMFV